MYDPNRATLQPRAGHIVFGQDVKEFKDFPTSRSLSVRISVTCCSRSGQPVDSLWCMAELIRVENGWLKIARYQDIISGGAAQVFAICEACQHTAHQPCQHNCAPNASMAMSKTIWSWMAIASCQVVPYGLVIPRAHKV